MQRSSACTRHLLSKAVDVVSLIEVPHSICPDPWEFLFVTIAVHARVVDRVPLVQGTSVRFPQCEILSVFNNKEDGSLSLQQERL